MEEYMKGTRALLFSFFVLFCFTITAQGAILFSLDLPKDVTIPAKAQVTAITYEKALPEYGDCAGGEACYVMALKKAGVSMTQDQIHKASTLTMIRGCGAWELYVATMNLGITGDFYNIWGFKTKSDRQYYLDALKYFISQGYPVMISWDEDPKAVVDDFCAFALATGYDDETELVTILDPYRGPETGRTIKYGDFLNQWQFDFSDKTYGLFMYVIKGQDKNYKEKLKSVTVPLAAGETAAFVYKNLTPNKSFLIFGFDKDKMVLQTEVINSSNESQWKEIINDWQDRWTSFRDIETFTLNLTCQKGQGTVTLTYDPRDGELSQKK
jgi:hypothetical protein